MTEINHRTEPWSIDESEFYELENRDDEMAFLVRYAVLAPSGHNTQPWTFRIVPEGIQVFADYTRRMPLIDPDDRELLMSVGAAIMNLRVAAAHFGYESTVLYQRTPCETPGVALVALRETCGGDPSLRGLFAAIQKRRTNRQPFDARPIDPVVVAILCDLLEEYPESMHVLLPRVQRQIAALVAEGDRIQMKSQALREELADWIRPSQTNPSDGVWADAFGVPDLLSGLGAAILRRLDLGEMQARRDEALVKTASLIAVITAEDDMVSLLNAGQILEHLLLTLTLSGLQYSFVNQPVQVAPLRQALAPILGTRRPAQLILRIGHAPAVDGPMPRRDLAEVLLAG